MAAVWVLNVFESAGMPERDLADSGTEIATCVGFFFSPE